MGDVITVKLLMMDIECEIVITVVVPEWVIYHHFTFTPPFFSSFVIPLKL